MSKFKCIESHCNSVYICNVFYDLYIYVSQVVEMVSFQSSLLLLVLATLSVADIPVDCHYDSIVGQWKFYESSATGKVKPDCSKFSKSLDVLAWYKFYS